MLYFPTWTPYVSYKIYIISLSNKKCPSGTWRRNTCFKALRWSRNSPRSVGRTLPSTSDDTGHRVTQHFRTGTENQCGCFFSTFHIAGKTALFLLYRKSVTMKNCQCSIMLKGKTTILSQKFKIYDVLVSKHLRESHISHKITENRQKWHIMSLSAYIWI